jgi:menaquinone-dependent protoporphyrinogen IX oxidase
MEVIINSFKKRVKKMNENKTLIAYATRGGTTEDYAKAIGSVLTNEFKMQADIVNLKKDKNPNLTPYRNVVVGTGIKMFKMHKEGAKFLEKTDFGERKVMIFLSSLTPRDDVIKKYIDVLMQKNTKLKPLAVEVLGGRMKVFGRITEDKTDIEKSKLWAREIAEQLQG